MLLGRTVGQTRPWKITNFYGKSHGFSHEWQLNKELNWRHCTTYPLAICYIAIEHGPFIVNFPINSMVIFHSYVSLPEGMENPLFPPWIQTGSIWLLKHTTNLRSRFLMVKSKNFSNKKRWEQLHILKQIQITLISDGWNHHHFIFPSLMGGIFVHGRAVRSITSLTWGGFLIWRVVQNVMENWDLSSQNRKMLSWLSS